MPPWGARGGLSLAFVAPYDLSWDELISTVTGGALEWGSRAHPRIGLCRPCGTRAWCTFTRTYVRWLSSLGTRGWSAALPRAYALG